MRELKTMGGLCSLVSLGVWFWGFSIVAEATTDSVPDYQKLYDGLSLYYLAVVLCLVGIALILMARETKASR